MAPLKWPTLRNKTLILSLKNTYVKRETRHCRFGRSENVYFKVSITKALI